MTNLPDSFLSSVTGGAFTVNERAVPATSNPSGVTPRTSAPAALAIAPQCVALDQAAREAGGNRQARTSLRRAADACWSGVRALSR